MASATYSQLLRGNKNFRRLWAGQVISELGTWFSFIAELGLVRMLSGSPLAATALLVARMLPFLLTGPVAGVVADKRSRKQIMIVADLLRAAIALAYIVAGALGSVWLVIVCSALNASLTMFFDAAKNAAMPNMVTPRELLTANVMMFSTRFLQYAVGAALGGVTAAQFGYDVAFIVNSLSFVASALYIVPIPAAAMKRASSEKLRVEAQIAEAQSATGQSRRDTSSQAGLTQNEQQHAGLLDPMSAETSVSAPIAGTEQPLAQAQVRFTSDLREGLAYIWATPFVRGIILINTGWATGGGMVNILLDQIGGHVFAHPGDRGDWNVAALFTAAGAGLFIGMMLARRAGSWVAEERRAGQFIGWSLLAHGLLLAVAGLMPTLVLMSLWIAASRLILAMEFGVQETLLMRVLPDEYRGRVFTTDRSLEIGMMSLSMLVGGWLLTCVDPRLMMIVSGALSASPGLAWLLTLWLTRFSVPAQAVRESFGD